LFFKLIKTNVCIQETFVLLTFLSVTKYISELDCGLLRPAWFWRGKCR